MASKLHAAKEAASEGQTASADREWKLQNTVEDLRDKLKAAEKVNVRSTVRKEKMTEQSRIQGERLRDGRREIEDLQQSQRNLMQFQWMDSGR